MFILIVLIGGLKAFMPVTKIVKNLTSTSSYKNDFKNLEFIKMVLVEEKKHFSVMTLPTRTDN